MLKEIYKDYKDMSLNYIVDAMKEAAKADKEIPFRTPYKNCRIAMLEMRFRYMEKVVAAGRSGRNVRQPPLGQGEGYPSPSPSPSPFALAFALALARALALALALALTH